MSNNPSLSYRVYIGRFQRPNVIFVNSRRPLSEPDRRGLMLSQYSVQPGCFWDLRRLCKQCYFPSLQSAQFCQRCCSAAHPHPSQVQKAIDFSFPNSSSPFTVEECQKCQKLLFLPLLYFPRLSRTHQG